MAGKYHARNLENAFFQWAGMCLFIRKDPVQLVSAPVEMAAAESNSNLLSPDPQFPHIKSLFPGLDHTFPRQSDSLPAKTYKYLTLSRLSSHNPAVMHLSTLFPSIVTLFIASTAASKHCTTTSTTTATCNNGSPTETVYGTTTETATISVNCHGCETLTYSTSFHVCPVSVASWQNGTICHTYSSEETDVLTATSVGIYYLPQNYRDRSHFCDYHLRLQQDSKVNSTSTSHI